VRHGWLGQCGAAHPASAVLRNRPARRGATGRRGAPVWHVGPIRPSLL